MVNRNASQPLRSRHDSDSHPDQNEGCPDHGSKQRVLELREEGVELNDIAVLFRSSFLSFDLEIELNKANIPYIKMGGFKFIETAHVKDLVAHLRVLHNGRDVVSWNRSPSVSKARPWTLRWP